MTPPLSEPRAAPVLAVREWRLGQWLAGLVLAATGLTFVSLALGMVLLRLPAMEQEHRALVEREAGTFAERQAVFLGTVEQQLQLVAASLPGAGQAQGLLDMAVADGQTLRALYLLSPAGRVLAVGLPAAQRPLRAELLGVDLSRLPLLRQAQALTPGTGSGPGGLVWGDRYTSPLSGRGTVGVLQPLADGRTLLAEVALDALLRMASPMNTDDPLALRTPTPGVWLVDSRGEVLADSAQRQSTGRLNLLNAPLLDQAQHRRGQAFEQAFGDGLHHVAVVNLPALNWHVVARLPAGWNSSQVRSLWWLLLAASALTVLVGLALVPLLANRLKAGLGQLVLHAQQLSSGQGGQPWRAGPVREFNALASALDTTTGSLRQREREMAMIFNTAPVAMAVSHFSEPPMVVAANDAWCRQFGHTREAVLGQPATSIRIWYDEPDRARAYAQALAGHMDFEARLRRSDGSPVLCRVTGQRFEVDGQPYLIWANEDITETRRIEQALRELNNQLEQRVAARTEALAVANAELTGTLARLQATRGELLRAEKLAALGRLVAGVAHELNTPLGNSLMAVSTLHDEVRQFRDDLAGGLRRSALAALMDSVDQATTIASRNLHRAAQLVSGFKQVAADQTSERRRRFLLHEVVNEIVLTLRPSFGRTPFQVHADVAPELLLDSYPGALGQVLTNLITNAVQHAFEGRDHGQVQVLGRAIDGAQVCVEVRDDGCGIAPDLLARVFDPFVTTRMGRGGTGLGLHIAHNAAVQILGGSLTVRSTPGQGSCFTLTLPRTAPDAPRPGERLAAGDPAPRSPE